LILNQDVVEEIQPRPRWFCGAFTHHVRQADAVFRELNCHEVNGVLAKSAPAATFTCRRMK